MSKALRAGILLIILAIPAFIILFLHSFGDNEFTVPVYYESGVDTTFAECNWPAPFTVREIGDQFKLEGRISVIAFSDKSQFDLNDLYRINVDYEAYAEFQSILLFEEGVLIPERSLDSRKVVIEEGDNFDQMLACDFVINAADTSEIPYVVVDQSRKIRGYYYVNDPEELERLIHELNILFDKVK